MTTQSKGRLIVILYEGTIKFLKLAIRALEGKNREDEKKYIDKAQEIIDELNSLVDIGTGGEIAENLRKLYLFMGRRLREASTKHDPQMIREVITLLEELNVSWKAVAG
ncbi:MAG: flagellar export chaperone FliS [Candidatus Pacearchaeota archaeon]